MAGFNGDLDARDNAELAPRAGRRHAGDVPLAAQARRALLRPDAGAAAQQAAHAQRAAEFARLHHASRKSRAARRRRRSSAARARARWWRENGRVVAIDCATADGPRRFRARGGVVLATGDFTSDPELKAQFMGPQEAKIDGVNVTATGDGQKLALAARRAHHQRRSRARAGTALRAAAAAQYSAEPAAVAGAGEPDGVVARTYAERAAAARS